MKKILLISSILLVSVSLLFSQEKSDSSDTAKKTQTEITEKSEDSSGEQEDFKTIENAEENSAENTEEVNPDQNKSEEVEDPTKPSLSIPKIQIVMDEGVSYCQITRIEKQKERNNFVRENMMVGAYYNIQTVDFSFFDFLFNLSAYYPVYYAFNGMKQKTRNMFNYGISTFFGTTFTDDFFKMVDITGSLGMHYMYQLTDEWHMHYIGLSGNLGLVWPLTNKWALVNNNFFSFDNANIGKNKNIQPFDGSYSYHIDFGVRYSPRVLNKYYYIDTSKHDQKVAQRKAVKAEKRAIKKEERKAAKIAKAEEEKAKKEAEALAKAETEAESADTEEKISSEKEAAETTGEKSTESIQENVEESQKESNNNSIDVKVDEKTN